MVRYIQTTDKNVTRKDYEVSFMIASQCIDISLKEVSDVMLGMSFIAYLRPEHYYQRYERLN